jgi:hypothetical protein
VVAAHPAHGGDQGEKVDISLVDRLGVRVDRLDVA